MPVGYRNIGEHSPEEIEYLDARWHAENPGREVSPYVDEIHSRLASVVQDEDTVSSEPLFESGEGGQDRQRVA